MTHTKTTAIMSICCVLLVSACSTLEQVELITDQLWRAERWEPVVPKPNENYVKYKVGEPYRVNNIWYYPEENPHYSEVGVASWYGPGFHNRLTANGEIYNKYKLTAAHTTLPMPSIVRVTNLENGKSIKVRLNDRGPFAKDRIIDLSYAAALKLGFADKGTARVRVDFDQEATQALFYDTPFDTRSEPKRDIARHHISPKWQVHQSAYTIPQGDYFIQTGAYRSSDNAYEMYNQLKKFGEPIITEVDFKGKRYYRVQLGPFTSTRKADKALSQMHGLGFSDAIIITGNF